jgi:phosphatidylserine decarboxylase
MRLAKEGYPLIVSGAAVTSVVAAVGWKLAASLLGLATLAIAGFFRDPERRIPAGEGLVVAPADGRVVNIADVAGGSEFGDAVTRVSIFLSPLDVHINRMPVAGRIQGMRYQRGEFLPAYKAEASARNEQNSLEVMDPQERLFGVVQIAGVLARRVVCRVKPGDHLQRGDRFGLIMFGSRTDLYLPRGCKLEISEGQRVTGGETIVARFG